MIPAMFSRPSDDGRIVCSLCPHSCKLNEGQTGICGVRQNMGGKLFSLNSDKVAAIHSDPIEKKPLYHFLPGSESLSIAAMGCNFKCRFCQNHSISMVEDISDIAGERVKPEDIIDAAKRAGASSISYTYTEPTIYYELMYETAKAAKADGLRNVMVSNGFISQEPLEKIIPFMDGANIDLKSFSNDFYSYYCGGKLAPVLDTIRILDRSDCWLELTTLLIPELNSSEEEVGEIISFITDTNPEIPWHISRFFPHFKEGERSATNTDLIEEVLDKAKERGIKYVYGGNFDSGKWGNTRCSECGEILINRRGYHIDIENFSDGNCTNCNAEIAGVWS